MAVRVINTDSAPKILGDVTKTDCFLFSRLQRFQTQIVRLCCQNFDKLDNSEVIPVYAGNFNICGYMRITFFCLLLVYFVSAAGCHCFDLIQNMQKKFSSKIEIFGLENPTDKSFRAIHLKMKETFILTDTMCRRMRHRTVLLDAGYFYYPDSYSHRTLIF